MIRNKMKKRPIELYLHIPFCVRKCEYCDFLSGPAEIREQEQYMEAMLKELKGRSEECAEYEVITIFIGGGTPSVVAASWIRRILDTIRKFYSLSEKTEITMEINPGTVKEEKLSAYYEAGINRLSIGLQSVRDDELQKLGRIHNFDQFLKTYEMAVKAGFSNINVDIMSGLPGQTVESFRESLQVLLSLNPQPVHISAYSLILEEGTPLCEKVQKGEVSVPEEEAERQMYLLTEQVLGSAGYGRYEISNYAKPGYECCHNCGYWKRTEYLGFGIGAASLMQECRFQNGNSLSQYIKNPMGVRSQIQKLSVREQMEEFMFLGLRLKQGISRKDFEQYFGCEPEAVYGDVILQNLKDGLLEETVAGYRLTQRGTDLSNYVMSQFLF